MTDEQPRKTRKDKGKSRGGKLSTDEAKKEYQRQWYLAHKDRQAKYQATYALKKKKKLVGKGSFVRKREEVKTSFNLCDFMATPYDRLPDLVDGVISGRVVLTM